VAPTNTVAGWVFDADGVVTLNTTDYVKNKVSLRAVVGSNTPWYMEYTFAAPVTFRQGVVIALKIDNFTTYKHIFVQLHEDDLNYWTCLISRTDVYYANEGEFVYYHLPYYRFTTGGSPTGGTWGAPGNETITANSIRLKFVKQSGEPGVCDTSIGDIKTYANTKAAVTFSFDDGSDTIYDNVYPMFSEYGWGATAYVIPQEIGAANKMTVSELQEMDANGWDIASHTFTHQPLLSSTPVATVMNEIAQSKTWLEANGLYKAADIVCAHGATLEAADRQGYNLIRWHCRMNRGITKGSPYVWDNGAGHVRDNVDGTRDVGYKTVRHTQYITNPANPWLPWDWGFTCNISFGVDYPIDTVAEMKAAIDHVIATGGVLDMATHGVETSPSTLELNIAHLEELLAYCRQKEAVGQLEVITKTEWWDLAHGKPVFRSTRADPGGNDITADLNHDDKVDLKDFSLFCEQWLLHLSL